MTKRVKLLSVMVAAVLCFVAGFALLFGSNKTAEAAVEVPTAGYSDQRLDVDWSTGKNFDGIGIGVRSGVTTDWVVLEYYVPVGASVAKAGNITFALLVSDKSTIGSEGDGVAAHTTYAYSVDSPYVANATDADVKVVLAMDIVNGKVYGSVADSEFAEIATFANISYVASAEKFVPYWILPNNTVKRLNNVKIYTEEGAINDFKAGNAGNFYQGGAAFNADKISMLNIPATAVKPSVVNTYATSGVKIRNANPTTSDWIFVEYTLSKDTTAGAGSDPNGYMTVLSNNGYDGHAPSSANENYVGVLHNNTSTYTQSDMHKLFKAVDGADTEIKIAVNTKTGLMATYINGTQYASKYQYSKVSALTGEDRYFYIANNSASVSGVLKNVVVYDGNGVNLGLVTSMAEIAPEVDASAIKGVDRSSQSNFWFATKTATTSKWIILEWTNGEDNTTKRNGGGWTWGVALGDENLASVTSTDKNVWHDFGTTYLGAETAGKDIKVTVNTENGQITVYVDGVAKESATRSVENLSNFKFRTGGNDAYTYNSTVYDLKAYDENGNDLGIETNMGKVIPTVDNVVAEEKFYAKASGGFSVVNAKATTSEWVFFEFDNLAGSTVTAPGGTCHWYQSVHDSGASVHVNNAPFTNGIAFQYNNGNYAVNAFNNATGNTVHTIIAIDTTTGTSYVSKDGGAFSVIMAFNGTGAKGDFPNTSKSWYAGFQVNAGNEGVMLENFKCYDAEGNDLGVVTTLGEVVEGTVVYANITTGSAQFNRYQGNVYFKDMAGNDIEGFSLGNIPALKYGEEATTLKFVSGGGALQLFMPTQNGKPDDWYNQWSDYDNEWYVVEAGTLVGSKVLLAEDMIIRMHNQTMQIFNASHVFSINYAGLPEGAVNANPTSYTFFSEDIVFEAPSAEGATFYAWNVASIPQYSFGDVTVTASWYSINSDYNIALTDSIAVNFVVNAVGYTGLYAEATMIYDGENAITKAGAFAGTFTFDGILPQHLADEIHFVVYNGEGGEVLIDTTVSVKGYLDSVIAAESIEGYSAEKLVAFKAIAEDLLYYGAAAQLYTGHDVENLPADLTGATDTIGAIDNVKAKDGEKDASYYWSQAALVYADTVKLYFKIAAPADSSALKVVIVNGEEQVVVTEFTAVEGSAPAEGLCYYEFTVSVAITEFDSVLTLNIYEGEEVKGQTLTYSVNSYVAEIVATEGISEDYLTLLERVWCYGASAKAFTEIA